MGCLAGVLVIVSYNMSGWRTFKALLRNPKSDVSVLLVTFFLTVIFDLTVAIEVGLLIACVLFMRRVMETTDISVIRDEIDPNNETDADKRSELANKIVQIAIDDNAFGYVGLFNKISVTAPGVTGIAENCPFDFYRIDADTDIVR